MGTLAAASAQQAVEGSVTDILKSVMKGKNDPEQVRQLAQRLSKFVPEEAKDTTLKKKPLLKSTNSTKNAFKSKEQVQQEGLQSLQGALNHPIAAYKKFAGLNTPSSLIQSEEQQAQLAKYKQEMDKLVQSYAQMEAEQDMSKAE